MSEQTKPKQNWGLIIKDMLIIMLIVCGVGVVCKLGMAAFERESPGEDLISIVNKNKLNEQGVNEDFLHEIERGRKKNTSFINSIDGNGISPLMWVCYANFNDADLDARKDLQRYNYVEYLLQQPEIDAQARDNTGMGSLHWAAWSGLSHCAALLMEDGADLNAGDQKGYTPLMLAALRGNVEMVQMLLALGADASAKNASGLTALDLAKKHQKSYQARSHWAFSLIYSKSRDKGHQECVAILQAPESIVKHDIATFMKSISAEQAEHQASLQAGSDSHAKGEQAESKEGWRRYSPLWKLLLVILIMGTFPIIIFVKGKKAPMPPTAV